MSRQNPVTKSCFSLCTSCFRCRDKGRYPEICVNCSGRNDPTYYREPDPDDACSCAEGVLRWVTKDGRRIVARIPGDPFAGKVKGEVHTADESSWEAYLNEQRERSGDSNWDPVRFEGGSSSKEWYDRYKRGMA